MVILWVDDNQDYLKTTQGLFKDVPGCEVLLAATIEDATKHVESRGEEIQVALIDMQMREGSEAGLELLLHIQRVAPLIQCIVVTAHGANENAVKCIKAGAFHYIYKDSVPFELTLHTIKLAVAVRSVKAGSAAFRDVKKGLDTVSELVQRLSDEFLNNE